MASRFVYLGGEVVDVVGVVGVVRSRILKRDEGVEEEMIRKCAVVSRVERCPNDGVDGAWIRRVGWGGKGSRWLDQLGGQTSQINEMN